MVILNKLLIQKKLLSFFTITGSYGGLYVVSTLHMPSPFSISSALFLFFSLLVSGIIIGTLAILNYKSKKNIFLKVNKNGDMLLSKQNLFLLTPLSMTAVFFIYSAMSVESKLILTFLSGGAFIIGLAGGIYDQFYTSTKKSIYLGLIPLSVAFIHVIFGTLFDITIIWISALLYLLSSLLTLNNIQLFKKVFNSKNINLKNTKKLRLYNFGLVSMFFLGFVVIVFFRKIFNSGKTLILGIINEIFLLLKKLTEWLYRNPLNGILPENDLPEMTDPVTMPFLFYILMAIFIVLLIILLVFAFMFIHSIIKSSKGKSLVNLPSTNIEYIEDIQILKTRDKLFIKRKYKFSKAGFSELNTNEDKIRYLYGFILESLYRKKIKIKLSNTPYEIRQIVIQYTNGDQLDEIGFKNLTDLYRKVRYGGKKVNIDNNILELAVKYEKAISKLIEK